MSQHSLQCTKYLDVKTPLGTSQNPTEQEKMFNSIGVDLYMPRATKEFIELFIKQNSTEKNPLILDSCDNDEKNNIVNFSIIDSAKRSVLIFSNKSFRFFKHSQIPNGVAILIPDGYHIDLRPRSSNHKNNYMTTLGLIDCDYTMQLATQIKLFSSVVAIEENERFAQLVMIKSEKIEIIECLTNSEFESLQAVQQRRNNRKDGFGSSGKF